LAEARARCSSLRSRLSRPPLIQQKSKRTAPAHIHGSYRSTAHEGPHACVHACMGGLQQPHMAASKGARPIRQGTLQHKRHSMHNSLRNGALPKEVTLRQPRWGTRASCRRGRRRWADPPTRAGVPGPEAVPASIRNPLH